jgi:hypothetical protein
VSFYFDFFGNFLIISTLIGIIGMLVFLAFAKYGWALIALFSLAINGVYLAPFFIPYTVNLQASETRTLSILGADFGGSTPIESDLEDLLNEAADGEILFFTGVSESAVSTLLRLKGSFPYHELSPLAGPGGVGIFSKHPLNGCPLHFFQTSRSPTLICRLDLNGSGIDLAVTFSPRPYLEVEYQTRNGHIKKLGEYLKNHPGPMIMYSNLNSPVWSAAVEGLMRDASLVSSRYGHGLIPTWPVVDIPVLGRIGLLPIHDLFVSSFIKVNRISTISRKLSLPALPLKGDIEIPVR